MKTEVKEYRPKGSRPLSAEAEWVLETLVSSAEKLGFRSLCLVWVKGRGTSGNVVTWPKPIISKALDELIEQRLIGCVLRSERARGGGLMLQLD
jgi:hypothetical protein